jgi:hypothetical protein
LVSHRNPSQCPTFETPFQAASTLVPVH